MTDFVAAEAGVRQLHARIVDAVFRKDQAAFGDCFTEDAEWRIAGLVLSGRAQIAETLSRFLGGSHRVLMSFGTPSLKVGPGVAYGRTYVTELNALKDAEPFATIGIYYERFLDQGDRWRCGWRHFQLRYRGPPDLAAPFFDQPDYGPPPGLPARDAPTFSSTDLKPR
jgi:hypothetical protein